MFEVMDNGKPASKDGFPIRFKTKEEAEVYATKWFYPFCKGGHLKNGPFDYSGNGDKAEIRWVECEEERSV